MNELFLLNCIGFIALVLVLWLVLRRFGCAVWVVDVALIAFTTLSIVGWVRVGKPDPMGYGHISKGVEIALIIVLLAHIGYLNTRRRPEFRSR